MQCYHVYCTCMLERGGALRSAAAYCCVKYMLRLFDNMLGPASLVAPPPPPSPAYLLGRVLSQACSELFYMLIEPLEALLLSILLFLLHQKTHTCCLGHTALRVKVLLHTGQRWCVHVAHLRE